MFSASLKMLKGVKTLAAGRRREEPLADERLRAAAKMLMVRRATASIVVPDLQIDVKKRFVLYPIQEVEEGTDA